MLSVGNDVQLSVFTCKIADQRPILQYFKALN